MKPNVPSNQNPMISPALQQAHPQNMYQPNSNFDNMQMPMQVPKHIANSNSIDMSTMSSPLIGMQNLNTNNSQGLSNFASPKIQNPQLLVKNQIPIQQQQQQQQPPSAKQQMQQQVPQNYQQQQQQPQYSLQQAAQQSSARKQQQQQQQRQVFPSQQLPTHPVQQLPTNQNQFGNPMTNQMQGNQFLNSNSSGAKLLPGLKATNEDWATLKEIYHETLSSPINLKDMTASLSDDDKRKVLGLAKQCKQLMILCQSIIIPNFYFLTKQRDATKRIMYSELMLKQILEKLSISGKYVADENLIHRIHDQIKKYLQFVKDQSSKIVKAQVQAQQVRAQQLRQQMELAGNVPPKGTFNQLSASNTAMTPSTLQNFQSTSIQDSFNGDSSQINLQMMGNAKVNGLNAAGSPTLTTPAPIQPSGEYMKPTMNNLQPNGAQQYPTMNAPSLHNAPIKPTVLSSTASTPAQLKKPKRKPSKTSGKLSNPNTPASSNTVASTPTSTTATANRVAANNTAEASTSTGPATTSSTTVNSAEIQAVLKANNENVEKEEARLKAIDIARARRRVLVSSTSQTSNAGSSPAASTNSQPISGAAAYFLSTLCDTLGLENEEKSIISNATVTTLDASNAAISGFMRSKSSNGNGTKVLTPSAVLATPIGLNAKTPVAKYPSALSPEELKVLPWTGKASADCIASAFRAIGNLNLNPSPTVLSSAASSASNSHKNSQTMSAGSAKTFVQLVHDRQSKRKTISLLYGKADEKKWAADSDSPWNWSTRKPTDKLKVYPTPPEEADCAKKRKLQSIYPNKLEEDSAAIKKIKAEDTDYDLLWDFDKV